jgi:hypothetical protein
MLFKFFSLGAGLRRGIAAHRRDPINSSGQPWPEARKWAVVEIHHIESLGDGERVHEAPPRLGPKVGAALVIAPARDDLLAGDDDSIRADAAHSRVEQLRDHQPVRVGYETSCELLRVRAVLPLF